MRKLILFLFMTVGVGTGIYVLPQSAMLSTIGGQLAVPSPLTESASATPTSPPRIADITVPRVFSAAEPVITPAAKPAHTPVFAAQPAPAPSTPVQTFSSGPIVAYVAAPPTPLAASGAEPAVRRLSSSRPADDDARRELVKDLQRELKRVGCYDGEMSGVWSPASKKAMSAFTERVNATLPLEEPDYILLTLIQGHSAQACGKACPTGQAMNDGGKCVPNAILAQTQKRAGDKSTTAQLVEQPAPAPRPDLARSQRQAASPQSTGSLSPPAATAKQSGSSWATVVTATPQATTAIAPVAATPVAPLPGRMAIGAPIDTAQVAQNARPSDAERQKAELARRKAQLTAAAESQRDAEVEAERRARVAEAQERRAARELQAQARARAAAETLQREAVQKEKDRAAARARVAAELSQNPIAPAEKDKSPKLAQLTPTEPTAGSPSPDAIADNAAIAAAARKVVLRKSEAQIVEKQGDQRERVAGPTAAAADQVAAAPLPTVNGRVQILQPRAVPAPRRFAPPPYGLGAVQSAPRPSQAYNSRPNHWTRTIFSDIARIR